MKRIAPVVIFCMAVVVLAGCAEHRVPPIERPVGSYAVAGVTNPKYDWQLLAGYLPSAGKGVSREVLVGLDQTVMELLASHGVSEVIPAANTRQCQEIVTFDQSGGKRISALKYWTSVGQCMKVDYLVIPQLLSWQERQGSDWGVDKPAGVVMDVYILDVNNGVLLARRHYDETQRALSEDLGNAGRHFDRGGTWLTAEELARYGLNEMLLELGL
ncbi:MAG: hypothetical protein AB7E32_06330 [Desulfovibrio sp.]